MNDREFDGQVALVTGGSSGIGRATALAFAVRGARVVVASRRADESAETAELIRQAGGDARFVRTDITQAAEVEALVGATIAAYGALHYVFNNAGIEGDAFVPLTKYAEATWDQVIVFLCMKYEVPHIVEAKGAIVNMASIAGLKGGRLGVAYYASKHGVVGLTRAAALEYADKGVRAFFHDPAIAARVTAMHPLGRVGTPEEVANAVVWLCSRGASFTTGHALPVDGGVMAA